MFETPPLASLPEDASSSWQFRMENRLTHIETDVHHLRDTQVHIVANQKNIIDDLQDIKTMMDNSLSLVIYHPRCCSMNICMFRCFYVFIPLFCNES
jgi:hypothetical protein